MGESDPDAVDYYSRLGASRNDDIESIERQRKQADRRFSPMSTSPDADEQRHMRINAASNVLEDPEERERYDACFDAFGRVRGTAVYETLSGEVVDDAFDDATLENHLEGFVEILGPVAGAREFESYYHDLNQPLADSIDAEAVPNGYAVEDPGFGIAVWSRHEADESVDLDRWLTGGRDLWRTALEDPAAVEEMLATLSDSEHRSVAAADTGSDDAIFSTGSTPEDDTTPTARVDGHPSSGTADLPNEYTPADQREERVVSREFVRTPLDRLRQSLAYVGQATAWGVGGTVAATAAGVLGPVAAGVVFLPLLAAGLLALSAVGGLNAAVESAIGVPLASSDAPFTTGGLVHYLAVLVAIVAPAAATARVLVPWIDDRKGRGLPRDAWLVFGLALASLSVALFVVVGQRALPRSAGVGLTALVAAGTFQAARDVGVPRVLSLLCRNVAAGAFGLLSAVSALLLTGSLLEAVAPGVAAAYVDLLTRLPLVASPLVGLDNVELAVVAFGALAFVPIALTTVYSLSYAVESVVLRIRSRAYS